MEPLIVLIASMPRRLSNKFELKACACDLTLVTIVYANLNNDLFSDVGAKSAATATSCMNYISLVLSDSVADSVRNGS